MSNEANIEQYGGGVNPTSYNSGSFPSGVGYVVLSREYDRKTYIENCYRNNTITLITDKSELIRNCLVLKSAWQEIQFPNSYKERGSCLVWINVPILNKCIIIGVLNKKDDFNNFSNNQSLSEKRTEQSAASVLTDGDNGSVKILSDSLGEEGGVFVNILNSDVLGMFKVYVQGTANIQAENSVQIKAKSLLQLWVGDENEENRGNLIELNAEQGFKFEDEYNNTIHINDEGIDIIDVFENKIQTDKDGINIERNNSIICIKDDEEDAEETKGVKVIVKDGDNIEFFDDQYKDDKDDAVLYTPVKDKLTQILDKMSDICQQIQTAKVVSPLGGSPMPMFPDTITLFVQLQASIELLKDDLSLMKSKTVKLT